LLKTTSLDHQAQGPITKRIKMIEKIYCFLGFKTEQYKNVDTAEKGPIHRKRFL